MARTLGQVSPWFLALPLGLASCGDSSPPAQADSSLGSGGISPVSATEGSGSEAGTTGTGVDSTTGGDTSGASSPTSSRGDQAGESGPATGGTGLNPEGDGQNDGSPSGSSSGGVVDRCASSGSSMLDFSYIWIANSSDGTISKIDTRSGEELGRYITRPDRNGNPSRTSVNARGDVAVANRNGGITKIFARTTDCEDKNGNGTIETSTGSTALAWDEEECVAWYTDIDATNNRPVAWTNGTLNPDTCEFDDVNVWTAFHSGSVDTLEIALLDGDDGSFIDSTFIQDTLDTLDPAPNFTLSDYDHGFYGAAVDGDDNAYFVQLGGGHLVRANASDLALQLWDATDRDGAYGITVTSEGYVWLCGLQTHRFDPLEATWQSATVDGLGGANYTGGCNGDGQGTLYRASIDTVTGVDTETMQTTVTLSVRQPDDDAIWGVAVDFDGFVWAIPRNAEHAYKVDPAAVDPTDPIVMTVDGLIDAYTYSDMTGFSLFSVSPG